MSLSNKRRFPGDRVERGRKTASLFVGNLHPDVSDRQLLIAFCRFGPIAEMGVCRDKVTKCSLGYGYVNFVYLEHAENAMEALSSEVLLGQQIKITWDQNHQAERNGRFEDEEKDNNTHMGMSLYVSNLAYTLDSEQLQKLFSSFGKITNVKVMMKNGRSQGYGFVAFSTPEGANKALSKMNGHVVANRPLKVERSRHMEGKYQTEAQDSSSEKSMHVLRTRQPAPSPGNIMATASQVTEAIEFPEAIEAANTSVDSSDMPAFNGLDSGEPSGGLPNTKV
ncbi:polyadenylate-binding protein 1A-like [Xyrauchen texanus]|uniref:polyadenylate-binding protein 1A-like n=1 Tax=Xyrauchen texanus TaxID=154827 RepID=UPI00224211B1|nr:polyadenylate-binding protein 1A-like [Xyrauchen texanus]